MRDTTTTAIMGPAKINMNGTKFEVPAEHMAELSIWHGPYVGIKKAAQIGEQVGVLVQTEDGKLAAVHDLGRVTWLDGADSGETAFRQRDIAYQQRDEMELKLSQFIAGAGQCEWHLADEDNGVWEAPCGACWSFIDGGPTENEVKFCPHCGKPLTVQPAQTQEGE